MTKRIYALGFFDGVHRGHQALLAACCDLAAENNCETAAITFENHPQSLFSDNPPPLINTVTDRKRLLRHFGITHVELLPVTKEVMSTNWREFLNDLVDHGAAGFVCGDDFRFGYRGEGNAEKLASFCKERGLPWAVVSAQNLDGTRISSTHIRTLLETGDIEEANNNAGNWE